MTEQLANNAASTLASGILAGDASLTLHTGDGSIFPASGNFRIVVGTEIIIVTARAGDVLTLGTRGAEGTTAASHSTGDAVTCVLTVAALQQVITEWGMFANLPSTALDANVPANQEALFQDVFEIAVGTATEINLGALLTIMGGEGPPGQLLDYAQITSTVSVSGTTEGSPTTIITGNSVYYDGTKVLIEFVPAEINANGATSTFFITRDSLILGHAVVPGATGGGGGVAGPLLSCYDTPPAGYHVYTVKGYDAAGTMSVNSGVGGAGNVLPSILRVTRV